MKIYKYNPDATNFCSLVLDENHEDARSYLGRGNSLTEQQKATKLSASDYLGEKEGFFPESSGDFPMLTGGIPVLSVKAKEVFAELCDLEFVDLKTSALSYFALNVNIIDALNEDKSDFVKNRITGKVSNIYSYSFNPDKIQKSLIFSIPQSIGREVYITDDFRKIVEENNLMGLDLSQVLFEM